MLAANPDQDLDPALKLWKYLFFWIWSHFSYIEEMASLYHLTFLQHLKVPQLKARKLKSSKR